VGHGNQWPYHRRLRTLKTSRRGEVRVHKDSLCAELAIRNRVDRSAASPGAELLLPAVTPHWRLLLIAEHFGVGECDLGRAHAAGCRGRTGFSAQPAQPCRAGHRDRPRRKNPAVFNSEDAILNQPPATGRCFGLVCNQTSADAALRFRSSELAGGRSILIGVGLMSPLTVPVASTVVTSPSRFAISAGKTRSANVSSMIGDVVHPERSI